MAGPITAAAGRLHTTVPGTAARAVDSAIATAIGNGRPLPLEVRLYSEQTANVCSFSDTIATTINVPTVQSVPILYYDVTVSDLELQTRLDNPSIADIAVEHAHNCYGAGTGDVLGPYQVIRNAASSYTTVRYAWLGPTEGSLGTAVVTSSGTNTVNLTFPTTWTNGQVFTDAQINGVHNQFINTITPEEWAAMGVRDAERQAQRVVVNQTAERLLLAHLTDEQRAAWLGPEKYFEMRAPSGRHYRLEHGHSGNVYLLGSDGKKVRKYCVYGQDPGGMLPMGDHLFTQLVTLRYNEQEFLAKANTWDLLLPTHPFVGQGADYGALAA